MLDSFSEGPGSPADQPTPAAEAQGVPVIDVVACDGADTSQLVLAAHGLGAEVRLSNSLESWLDQIARETQSAATAPADLVVLVGGGERTTSQRWVARAASAAAGSRLVAAVVDGTLDHAMNVVGQGARGLIVLPNSDDRISFHLREAVEVALRDQPRRRQAAKHKASLATLTAGETQVLDGMMEGLANKQIAQRLSIGLRTVELRRSKIMKKMNAVSLAQLISFICAAREGSE